MPNDIEVVAQENDTVETEVEQVAEESVDDLKKKLAELTSQKEHWREKAQKVEKKPEENSRNLTPGDLLAITKANIIPEDMDRVDWFAKANSISLREALEHPEMKAILALREEQRNTAIASNVENVRRGSSKVTDDTLLENARAGKFPTSDDEIERLIAARITRK